MLGIGLHESIAREDTDIRFGVPVVHKQLLAFEDILVCHHHKPLVKLGEAVVYIVGVGVVHHVPEWHHHTLIFKFVVQ